MVHDLIEWAANDPWRFATRLVGAAVSGWPGRLGTGPGSRDPSPRQTPRRRVCRGALAGCRGFVPAQHVAARARTSPLVDAGLAGSVQ